MRKIFLSLAISLTTLAGCTDPNDGSLFVTPTEVESEMSVVDILEKSPEQYSMWVEFLKHADFYNALKDASSRSTIFCPTNGAILNFLAERKLNSVSEVPYDYARSVVKVHIIEGTPITETTVNNYAKDSTYIPTQSLFGSYLSLQYGYKITDVDDAEQTNIVYNADTIYINNQAKLDKFTAVICANGAIYTVGDVILPLAENIVEKLEMEEEYSIFAQAIRSNHYADSIATLVSDTTIAKDGGYVVTNYNFTCFAVPDRVYQANGITDVNTLKAYLVNNSNGEETGGDEALTDYLKYHFLSREYTASDLFNFQSDDETLIFDTKLEGQAIITNNLVGANIINQSVFIVRSDIDACNGKIHKVDNVMPVYHPTPVTVKWDFLNSADIISFVNAYGAANNLGNMFTSPMQSSERKVDISEDYRSGNYGTITSLTYQANDSKTSYNSYYKVGFTKECYASQSSKNTSRYGSYMNNYLILNLGYAGWVSFETPSIIAGKYKVVLHYCKDFTMSKFFTSGTMTKFNLDNSSSVVYLYKGLEARPLYEVVEATLWNSITFDESITHTFKVTLMDINAKTNNAYHQMLDYVEFIPID